MLFKGVPVFTFWHFCHPHPEWNERAGLGDRFFQYIVGMTYALHVDGGCIVWRFSK